jgi:hypothetical protein
MSFRGGKESASRRPSLKAPQPVSNHSIVVSSTRAPSNKATSAGPHCGQPDESMPGGVKKRLLRQGVQPPQRPNGLATQNSARCLPPITQYQMGVIRMATGTAFCSVNGARWGRGKVCRPHHVGGGAGGGTCYRAGACRPLRATRPPSAKPLLHIPVHYSARSAARIRYFVPVEASGAAGAAGATGAA